MQKTLVEKKVKYSLGAYNKFDANEQWIRITEGCPWHHEFCYEPSEIKFFGIPTIVRNKVKIMDMNLLCKPEALQIIRELGEKRVGGRVVEYELICGIDFRFLTQELANALKKSRFTPGECEALQSFPRGWTEGVSDSVRYRLLGNSITVNVAEMIFKEIKKVV